MGMSWKISSGLLLYGFAQLCTAAISVLSECTTFCTIKLVLGFDSIFLDSFPCSSGQISQRSSALLQQFSVDALLKLNSSISSSTVPTLLSHSVFFNCTDLLGYKGWPCWLLHCPQLLGLVDYAPCLLLGVCPDNMMAGWAVFLQMWLSKWIVPGKKVNFYNVAKNSLVSFGGWHGALLLVRAGLEVTVHVEVASDIQPGEQGSHKPGLCTP